MHAPTILSVLAAAVYAMLAVYPLASGPPTRPGRAFLVLTLLLATCSASQAMAFEAADAATAWTWYVAGSVAWGLFTPMCVLLPLGLARKRPLPAWGSILLGLPALAGMAVSLVVDAGPDFLVRTTYGWARDLSARPALWNVVGLVLFAYVVAALVVIGWWRRQASTRRERRQAAWLLGSGALGVASAAAFQLFHPLSQVPDLPRIHHVFGIFWAAGYAIAIFRHRMMAPSASLASNAILSGIQDLVFVIGDNDRVLEANPRACALMGRPVERLRGLSIADLFTPEDTIRQSLAQTRESGKALDWIDATLGISNDIAIPVTLMFAPILDDFGDGIGCVAIAQDQRPMREALKAERIASIGVLAGGIAHDFNNLLTAIGGYIDLARIEVTTDSATDRRLTEASRACERAQGLTHQLLTFSRGGTPVRKAIALPAILNDSAAFATSGSRVRADVRVPEGLWLIDADGAQIVQVVHNLALNAVQAMPGGGTLTIAAQNVPAGTPGLDGKPLDRAMVRLTVTDQGTGIPADLLHRVCEPFFSTKPEGSGLGLATAFSIVRRHGGDLRIESEPGRGTCVRIDLPRAKRPTDEMAILVPKPPRPGRRALVMDDQPQVEAVAREMLMALGWDVVGTPDGDEAIHAFEAALREERPFDLVVLDLTVPGGTGGVEAVRRMRQTHAPFYAVLSSGYGEEAVLSDPGGHGFDDVLPKPYSCNGMHEMVARFERRGPRNGHDASSRTAP